MFLKQAPVKRKVTEKDPKKKLRKYDPDYTSHLDLHVSFEMVKTPHSV